MKKHANIPIFIPHLGCPNQCVFCNQRTISGVNCFDISSVKSDIDTALSTMDSSCEAEIAFFGGSFTGIERSLMTELLEIAYEYVKSGAVKSIRCSTRPDYIDDEVLDILERYGVRTIELGLQSSYDAVLLESKRGHTFKDELRAVKLIKDRGFDLVGQMMIGLPSSTIETELRTAEFIISSNASAARIYPTVVFKDTELYEMAEKGMYQPISLDEAVTRSAAVLDLFYKNDVDVIRIGLCAQESLSSSETYFAGPNHPALGELVVGELYYRRICDLIDSSDVMGEHLNIFVARGAVSKAKGQKKKNITRLISKYGFSTVTVTECDTLSGYRLYIEYERK